MQIVPNFRVRTIPVLGTMPAIFGMAAASYILCQLAQLPFHPEPIFKLVEGQYETQLQRLAERENLVYGNSEGPAVDLDDVRPPSLLRPINNAGLPYSRADLHGHQRLNAKCLTVRSGLLLTVMWCMGHQCAKSVRHQKICSCTGI